MNALLLGNAAGRTMLLVLAVLIAATGLCLFDHHADRHDHAVVIDLCLGMLIGAVVVAPLIVLTVVGPTTAYRPLAFVPVGLHVLDPPPKSLRRR
jgi:hypothetical protein